MNYFIQSKNHDVVHVDGGVNAAFLIAIRDLDSILVKAAKLVGNNMSTFEANSIFAGCLLIQKVGLSLKPNHHNQVKLVQIPDTLCIKD